MGRKLNLGHLTEEECEHILDVVHKDFNLRHVEKERLRQIEEDVVAEETKYSILSKSRTFNEKSCICCFTRFIFFFNPSFQCDLCTFRVCKSCAEFQKETKTWRCSVCLKQRELKQQSNEWFYSNVEKKFKRCGSAKVIRSLYKRRCLAEGSVSMVLTSRGSSSDMKVKTPFKWNSMDESIAIKRGRDDYDDYSEDEDEHVMKSQRNNIALSGDDYDISSSSFDGQPGCDASKELSSPLLGSRLEETSTAAEDGVSQRTDSSIQTENQRQTTDTGTMTFETASRCFSGFDGMSTVSTEGQELDPRFVVRPHNIRVLEGEPLVIECKVTGTEPLDVLWFCNRNQVQQLEEGARCEIRRDGDTFSLTVFSMVRADSLDYMCIAVNGVGQCAQGFMVTVDENCHTMKQPEVSGASQSVEIVPEGSSATLRCSVSAYPEPKVTWFKDKRKLKHGGRYQMVKHEPGSLQYALVIDPVRADDSGVYHVVATNIAGESHCSLELLVQPNVSGGQSPILASDSAAPSYLSGMEELMRLAEGVSRTQGRYTTTATRMLRSADMMSSMQNQLDEMDRALKGIEGEVLDVISDDDDDDDDEDSANNNSLKVLNDPLDDVKSSAEAVGMVTTAALQLLSSAKELAMETLRNDGESEEEARGKDGMRRVDDEKEAEEEWEEDDDEEEDEECVDAEELKLSYEVLKKLYNVGLISRSQLKHRSVWKRNVKRIRSYLQTTLSSGIQVKDSSCSGKVKDSPCLDEDLTSSRRCGHQSQDSVMETSADSLMDLTGEEPQQTSRKNFERKKMRSAAAAAKEDPETVLKNSEEQIYMTAGKVFSLEDCIRDLERQVLEIDENTSAETLANLENNVARAVAQVTQSDAEVNDIESQVEEWMDNANRNTRAHNEKNKAKLHPLQIPSSPRIQRQDADEAHSERDK